MLSDTARFNTPAGHAMLAMITTQRHPAWPLDCPIRDPQPAGLPTPSLVRFKLFTLDHRLVRGELGRLAAADAAAVQSALASLLGDRV